MCGIVGFVGREEAAPILLDGLSRLEYRGYDSAGIAVYGRREGLQVVKAKGRLQVLQDQSFQLHYQPLISQQSMRWDSRRPFLLQPLLLLPIQVSLQ